VASLCSVGAWALCTGAGGDPAVAGGDGSGACFPGSCTWASGGMAGSRWLCTGAGVAALTALGGTCTLWGRRKVSRSRIAVQSLPLPVGSTASISGCTAAPGSLPAGVGVGAEPVAGVSPPVGGSGARCVSLACADLGAGRSRTGCGAVSVERCTVVGASAPANGSDSPSVSLLCTGLSLPGG